MSDIKYNDPSNPDSNSHFEVAMSEVVDGMIAREGEAYAKAVCTLFSIINVGMHSMESKMVSHQVAQTYCLIDPVKYQMEKLEADMKMLFKYQNEHILRTTNGPTST